MSVLSTGINMEKESVSLGARNRHKASVFDTGRSRREVNVLGIYPEEANMRKACFARRGTVDVRACFRTKEKGGVKACFARQEAVDVRACL